jgi:hypothetical protein
MTNPLWQEDCPPSNWCSIGNLQSKPQHYDGRVLSWSLHEAIAQETQIPSKESMLQTSRLPTICK